MMKIEACHYHHPSYSPPSFSGLCHQTQNTIINIRVNSMAVWLQGNLGGCYVGEDIRTREEKGVHLWKVYDVCTIRFSSFPPAASANTALRQSTGIVLKSCLRLLVRFTDWAQTSRRHSNKKCSTCFEHNFCTVPSECVKAVKLRLALRHNLNTVKLIVSKLSTRNGLSNALYLFTHSYVFLFL